MKVVIRFTAREELKAIPILLRKTSGIILPKRIYILEHEAARLLRDDGIRFTVIGREASASL